MRIYVHHNCNSCKKALKWLAQKEVQIEVVNLLEKTPSLEEFEKMTGFQKGNLKKLFNTSGQLYREKGLKDQVNGLSTEDVYQILSEEGMLVKRPFLISEKVGLLGFKEELWAEQLA